MREHFGGSELIDEVRLIRDRQGQQKGFAYIQFYEATVCQDAIAKFNKTIMKGKLLTVEITKSKDQVLSKVAQQTLIITNLSFRVSEQVLTDFLVNMYCDGQSKLVEKVNLVKDERGSSKGFAFV